MTIIQTLWLGVISSVLATLFVVFLRRLPGQLISMIGGLVVRSIEGTWSTEFDEKKNEYLFSLQPEYRQHLKEGSVSNDLSKTFDDNQQPLTSNPRLTRRDEKKWTITDGMKEYRIEDTGTELNIYKNDTVETFEELVKVHQVLHWVWGKIYYPHKGRIYKFHGTLRESVLVATYEVTGRRSTIARGAFTVTLNPSGDVKTMKGQYACTDDKSNNPNGGVYKWYKKD